MATRPSSSLSSGLRNVKNLLTPLVLIIGLICSPISLAKNQIIESKEHGFSLDVPPGWRNIPRHIILKNTEEASQGQKVRPPSYAFETEDAMIRIDVKREKMPQGLLEMIPQLPQSAFREREELFRHFLPSKGNIKMSQPVFDKNTGYLWIHAEFLLDSNGTWSMLSVTVPLNNGYMTIAGFTDKGHYQSLTPVFHRMIQSINVRTPLN